MSKERDLLAEENRAAIVAEIYDVALDPSRYEQLLDLWEDHIAPLRKYSDDHNDRFRDPILGQHLARAEQVLAGNSHFDRSILLQQLLQSYLPMAALVLDADSIISVNQAAGAIFGVAAGDRIDGLPVTPEQIQQIKQALATSSSDANTGTFVRCGLNGNTRPVVFRLARLPEAKYGAGLVLATTTETVWLPGYDAVVRKFFDLSATEIDIVKALFSGENLGEFAARRQRSVATARTQLRSIFRKVGVNSQLELVKLMLGVLGTGDGAGAVIAGISGGTAGRLETLPHHSMTLSDGRRYDYQVLGDPGGRAILFHGSSYGFTRWPARAEAALKAGGLRVIAPVRPGFGHSADVPRHLDRAEAVADANVQLLDHLGIEAAPMITISLDAIHAYALNAHYPHRLTAIIGCGGGFPVRSRKDYDRMGKWFRFMYANARYAPLVLPYIVRTGQMMTRRLGKKRFMEMVHGQSPASLEILADPEVMEAIIVGSETTISAHFTSHDAVAAETMLHCRDWSDWITACQIPQVFFVGDDDQAFPPETITEIAADFPDIEFVRDKELSELIFFKRWPDILDRAVTYLSAHTSV